MKEKKTVRAERPLRRWLILQSVAIVIISVMAFLLVEFFINRVMTYNPYYDPINGLGMIGPMGILMWFLSYNIIKKGNKYLQELMQGISKVAGGDFSTRLDERTAGPVRDLYKNFNKMTSELEGVQTLRDDFINHFSHEFKTPIMSIHGFASLLMEENVTEDEESNYLGIIAAESQRLANLSESALLLAKLESQQLIPEPEEYPLDEQIKECVIMLLPRIEKKYIDLSADLKPAMYNGNADLMKHVWLNLIGNAVKFTEKNGKIDIELTESPSEITVSISDSGIGMNEEVRLRIFEKYYQDEGNDQLQGLGLGLAIVKKIVDLCSGRVEVTSEPGEGSCFAVFLPKGRPE